ncbi:MAG: type 1 glutamine amidotransferase [Candidatus Micrarchaeota archaeon]|nr:type 1 glutamine amidotransferase [Candidatus Micrarchaeota archaeon]MBU1681719.1 type 1 glutamine amidotransferase [Candidatus Micrarchaeota archaeon]
MPYKRTMSRLRIAIIGSGPASQEPLTYVGARWTVRGLLGRKLQDFAKSKRLIIESHLYWPAGNPRDYPIPGTYDALVFPGSKLNIDKQGLEENHWMGGLLDFIRETDSEVPVLGICFGHQAIAVARGGRVERIPKPLGAEVGFSPVFMTEEGQNDEIFDGIPANFSGLFSHFTYVSKPPRDSSVLAYGVKSDMVQAYKIGSSTWGVQFHPDYSPQNIDELVDRRKSSLGRMLDLSNISTINPERHDHRVLENFVDHAFETLN